MEPNTSVFVGQTNYKRLFKCKNTPALRVTQEIPKLSSDDAGARRINRYYQVVAERWRTRWEGEVLHDACSVVEEGAESLPWEAQYAFTVTYNRDGLLSLYTDAYEFTGGAHGNTVRRGDTWEIATGTPRTLYSFFPGVKHPKEYILQQIIAEAEAQEASGEHLFYENYQQLMREQFDPNRFYLTQEGIALFYPQYAIAPYVEGFPTFTLTK